MDSAVHSDVTIHAETRFDVSARERLLDAAFGPSRRAKTSERLRDGRMPAEGLAFTARADGRLIGTIRLWNVVAGGAPALLLGPLAVDKSHEGQGVGSKLMRRALAEAHWLGHKAVILVGDAPYYARFGFGHAPVADLMLPGPVDPARFLGLELEPGALSRAHGLVVPAGGREALRRGALRKAA
ncbi:MAG: GNAT family N-acetyltransferase [Beijerinckiaceae bacterium]